MLTPSQFFPPPESPIWDDHDGLVFIGGELTPEWLLDAYSHGIFPWPVFEDQPEMTWWSPDPRAIIELDGLHVSRRLARTCRSRKFSVTHDQDFRGVVTGCATADDRVGATWITGDMYAAYVQMHALGHAHSIEVWSDGQLAGGIYGIAVGSMFAGESMFHYVRDASKVALVHLVRHLRERGFTLLDIQQLNPHTKSMGGIEMPRCTYLARLAAALQTKATW